MATYIKYFMLLVFFTTLMSCKQNGDTQVDVSLPGGDYIEVELFIMVKNDANVKLFYTNDKNDAFTKKALITKNIAGAAEVQHIIFRLPPEALKPQLRLDIEKVNEFILQKFRIKYGKRMIDVQGAEIFRYFRPDYTKCTIDIKTGTITGIENTESLSLYPHSVFMNHQMEILTGK